MDKVGEKHGDKLLRVEGLTSSSVRSGHSVESIEIDTDAGEQ